MLVIFMLAASTAANADKPKASASPAPASNAPAPANHAAPPAPQAKAPKVSAPPVSHQAPKPAVPTCNPPAPARASNPSNQSKNRTLQAAPSGNNQPAPSSARNIISAQTRGPSAPGSSQVVGSAPQQKFQPSAVASANKSNGQGNRRGSSASAPPQQSGTLTQTYTGTYVRTPNSTSSPSGKSGSVASQYNVPHAASSHAGPSFNNSNGAKTSPASVSVHGSVPDARSNSQPGARNTGVFGQQSKPSFHMQTANGPQTAPAAFKPESGNTSPVQRSAFAQGSNITPLKTSQSTGVATTSRNNAFFNNSFPVSPQLHTTVQTTGGGSRGPAMTQSSGVSQQSGSKAASAFTTKQVSLSFPAASIPTGSRTASTAGPVAPQTASAVATTHTSTAPIGNTAISSTSVAKSISATPAAPAASLNSGMLTYQYVNKSGNLASIQAASANDAQSKIVGLADPHSGVMLATSQPVASGNNAASTVTASRPTATAPVTATYASSPQSPSTANTQSPTNTGPQLQTLQTQLQSLQTQLSAAQVSAAASSAKTTTTYQTAPAPVPANSNTTVSTATVKSGDTLANVAYKNGMTAAQLWALNPQIKDPTLIHPGDVLKLSATPKPSIASQVQQQTVSSSSANTQTAANNSAQVTALQSQLQALQGKVSAAQNAGYGPNDQINYDSQGNILRKGAPTTSQSAYSSTASTTSTVSHQAVSPTASSGVSASLPVSNPNTSAASPSTLIVKSGDTTAILAQKNGLSIPVFEAANPQHQGSFALIHPGEVLNLPTSKTAQTSSASSPSSSGNIYALNSNSPPAKTLQTSAIVASAFAVGQKNLLIQSLPTAGINTAGSTPLIATMQQNLSTVTSGRAQPLGGVSAISSVISGAQSSNDFSTKEVGLSFSSNPVGVLGINNITAGSTPSVIPFNTSTAILVPSVPSVPIYDAFSHSMGNLWCGQSVSGGQYPVINGQGSNSAPVNPLNPQQDGLCKVHDLTLLSNKDNNIYATKQADDALANGSQKLCNDPTTPNNNINKEFSCATATGMKVKGALDGAQIGKQILQDTVTGLPNAFNQVITTPSKNAFNSTSNFIGTGIYNTEEWFKSINLSL